MKLPAASHWIWIVLVGLATGLLHAAAFPPAGLAELAFVFLVPAVWWTIQKPGLRAVIAAGLIGGFSGWVLILIWLRHVTWGGTIFVALLLTCLFLLWFLALAWTMPRLVTRPTLGRIFGIAGLAGLWVVLEWVRSWLFTGFPWATLAASQWERPAILQMLPWTGAWGASFLLIVLNLSIALYSRHLVKPKPLGLSWTKKFCGEFYFGFGLLMVAFLLFFRTLPEPNDRVAWFTAGIVQPYAPPDLKWDTQKAEANLQTLIRLTEFSSVSQPDVILWPEAATFWPVLGDPRMQEFLEEFTADLGIPLLLGSWAQVDGYGYNGIFVIDPEMGLQPDWYAKQKLVPFGEYIPLRRFLPFVNTVVPIDETFRAGSESLLLPVRLVSGLRLRVAPLVCYEDIFPHLSRRMARLNPDVFFVATNNAWYGEEGGAYQHAAHSVLRAAETRRPFLRVGNAGWSGWIDEFGNVRQVALDNPDGGTIYYRGTRRIDIARNLRWAGQETFYTRWGDWFVAFSGLLSLGAGLSLRQRKEAQPEFLIKWGKEESKVMNKKELT